MSAYAIAQPWGRGAGITWRVRYIVTDVPDGLASEDVLDWIDDLDPQLDRALPEDEWPPSVQTAAESVPRVRWRGRAGRPRVGTEVKVRIPDALLADLDARAERDGTSRAEALRSALAIGLASQTA